MHQNIKNFYEMQGIEKPIEIFLSISPSFDINTPKIKININENYLYEGELKQKISLQHKIELLENIDIKIQLYNNNEKINPITIESLKINSFEIVPKYLHLIDYKDGLWNFKIKEPFYRWKHRVTEQGWLLEP